MSKFLQNVSANSKIATYGLTTYSHFIDFLLNYLMKRPFSQGEAIWFQEIFPKMVKIVDCIFFRFVNKVSTLLYGFT